MRTLPAHFEEHKRDGSDWIYLVDVFPRGADSWSQYRWAEQAVTVEGNAYLGGYIKKISPIRQRARIREGGAVAVRESVSIDLINRGRLDRDFQTNQFAGRDVRIALALMPINQLKNSSFEIPTSGNDFTNWTETIGHASNAITRETGIKNSGAQSCKIVCVTASPAPVIASSAVPIRAGTTISLSFFARAVAAADVLRVTIRLAGSYYWNNSTKTWSLSSSFTDFSPSSSAFERFTIENVYNQVVTIPEGTTADITVEFSVPTAGDGIYLDDVMIEPRVKAGTYHRSRYEMLETELHEVYWGELEEPVWDRLTIPLKTKSIMNRRHRDIPTTIVTQSLDADFVIPSDNVGKPFPMTFGDFENNGLIFDQRKATKILASGILVNESARVDAVRVCFDKPGQDLFQMTRLYHYSPGLDKFIRETIDTASGNASEWTRTATEARATSIANAVFLRRGTMGLSVFLWSENGPGIAAPGNCGDRNLSTTSDIVETAVGTNPNAVWIWERSGELAQMQLEAAYAIGKVDSVVNSGSGVVRRIEARINRKEGFDLVALYPGAGAAYNNVPTAAHQHANEQAAAFTLTGNYRTLEDVWAFWSHCVISAGTSPNVTFKFYEFGLRLDSEVPLGEAIICCSLIGRTFGSTWDGRKTSGNAIEQPAEIVEGILRQELGIAGADIDTAAMDAVNSARALAAAGQITQIMPSTKAIEEICAAYMMVYFVDGDGKESIAALDHGAAAKSLWPRDLEDKPGPKFSHTGREDVVTDYILHYGYVAGADVYTRSVQCNRTYQNIGDASYLTKCDDAYEALGNVDNFREYYSRWINDDATAIAILKRIIDWNRSRRRTSKVEGFADLLAVEFGDRIDLKLEQFMIENDTDTTRPVFVPEQITIDHARVELELLEVIEP